MTDFHLDDETLSAVLDGEATPEEAAHADACAACNVRLDELRGVARLVGTAVPPLAPAAREAAIAAALAVAPAEASVTPLRRRLPPAWLAAAAVVVVVATVGLLSRVGGDEKASTASGTTDESALAESAADAFALAAPAQEAVDGGDLGDVAQVDLRPTISEALNRPQTAAGAAPASGGAASDSVGRVASIPCDPEVQAEHPDLGPLVFHAIGTLDGDQVVVLAYDVIGPDATVDRWVFVTAIDGCALRDQQTFAA